MPTDAASSAFLYPLYLLSEINVDCVDVHMSVSAGVLKRVLCAKPSVLCHLQGLHPFPSSHDNKCQMLGGRTAE